MNEVRCNLLVIRSRHVEQAACFYEALGLQFTKHRHGNGPEHLAAELESQTFEIYPLGPDTTLTTETRFGFAVNEVDEVFVRLLQAGGTPVSSPTESQWGRRAVVCDPDGHRIELCSRS